MPKDNKIPKFTIFYNTTTKESKGFIGTAWEFFFDEQVAKDRKEELQQQGKFPTLRPYFHNNDSKYLGAGDQYWVDKYVKEQSD